MTKMTSEIYQTHSGLRRVNIGSRSYRLDAPETPGYPSQSDVADALSGRDLMLAEAGEYGPVLQAWVAAARECGLPLRYAWHGVENSLGDSCSAAPPWRPKAKDLSRG